VPNEFQFAASDETDTLRLARALADVVPPGTVVALHGTLGAGKTRFVQGVAAACGIDPKEVSSPTFVLAQEYHGQMNIVHVDAYRLRDEDEFEQLGVAERFGSDHLVFIEWAERVAGSLPSQRIDIAIEVTGAGSRRFTISGNGSALESVVRELSVAVGASRRTGTA
jgi:tRNA threonylcarbamoyladenosine biosynthesis protein TsaE